jgi:imidazolonepropionase-like amidohydrolase
MASHRLLSVRIICALILLGGIAACAQAAPGYSHTGNTIITGVRVIDGLGNEPIVNQDITIVDGKIAAIGPSGSLEAPDGALTIDGSGMSAMPGLIDMHIHLKGGWTGGNAMPEKYSAGRTDPELQQTLSAFLYSGVTTVLDVGNPTVWTTTQRDRINGGELLGPRFFTTGMVFSQAPSGWDGANEAEGITDPAEFSVKVTSPDPKALNALLDEHAEHDVKIIKLYSGMSALGATFLLREAKNRGIRAVADLWQLNMDVDWMRMTGLDGWAHSTPFEVSESANAWMAANDRFVIATANVGEKLSGLRVKEDAEQSFFDNPLVIDIWGREVVEDFYASYPQVRHDLYEGPEAFYQVYNFGDLSGFRDAFLKNIKNAWDAGVLVAGGTDAPAYPSLWSGETMHRELELFVMAGISPIDAIKACTYNAATILQDDGKYGSLQEGLSADILIVQGNPAENISDSRNVRHVFSQGRQVDRDSLKLRN